MFREAVLDVAIFNIRGCGWEDKMAPSLDDNTRGDGSAVTHGCSQRQGVVLSDFASRVCYSLAVTVNERTASTCKDLYENIYETGMYSGHYVRVDSFLFLPTLFLGFSCGSFISRLWKLSGDRDGPTHLPQAKPCFFRSGMT